MRPCRVGTEPATVARGVGLQSAVPASRCEIRGLLSRRCASCRRSFSSMGKSGPSRRPRSS
eukprot:1958810-Pyramimonas_sp.AAC.1